MDRQKRRNERVIEDTCEGGQDKCERSARKSVRIDRVASIGYCGNEHHSTPHLHETACATAVAESTGEVIG